MTASGGPAEREVLAGLVAEHFGRAFVSMFQSSEAYGSRAARAEFVAFWEQAIEELTPFVPPSAHHELAAVRTLLQQLKEVP